MARGVCWLGILLLAAGCGRGPETDRADGIDAASALGGAAEAGYARAEGPREFRFPADHGPHPAYRNEWWYLTGNLEDAAGRRFGFQVTFFRIALRPDRPERPSAWGTRDVYMAHFAVTDAAGERFYAFERFARGAAGLAGARLDPFRVWLGDWRLAAKTGNAPPWRLEVGEGALALALRLEALKRPVLQGEDGLSQKGAEEGNASYYYSLPRLRVDGDLRLGGHSHAVTGTAWLDREWSTSALEPGQRGWDWFALQLEDGTDLMFYRLRREGGATDPRSAGVVVGPDGASTALGAGSVELEPLRWWSSPKGGRYPVAWRMRLPQRGLELSIEPVLSDQELDLSVRYWEGAVDVSGLRKRRKIKGRGYVELTGYGRGD